MQDNTKKVVARILDYKKVFSTPEGERVLYDLMRFGNMMIPTYKPGDDSNTTHFREGQRNVVLYVLTKLKADPSALLKKIEKGEENGY